MLPILSEYLKFFVEYSAKYGEKTAVLMQVGSFYEIYGVDNNRDKLGNATEMSRILNIVLTRKNKKQSENGPSNPLMLGFPCLALQKFVPMLLGENYTIVVVDQDSSKGSVTRAVVNVISPSTYIEDGQKDAYLAVVYADKHLHVGVSCINVVTGDNVVYESYSRPDDAYASLDDAMRFLKQYSVREVVVTGNVPENVDLASYLDVSKEGVLCHRKTATKMAHNMSYQNAVIETVFENDTVMSGIELIGLERKTYALISYVLLLEFVHDHNPILLEKISHPEISLPLDHLVLATNTVDQLNLGGHGKKRRHTLFGTIDKCSTSVGKRLLMKRMMSPIFCTETLEELYDQIEAFGSLPQKEITTLLSGIVDIDRLQRRLSMGIITSAEICSMISSYRLALELNDIVSSGLQMSDETKEATRNLVRDAEQIFDFENIDTTVFHPGVFPDVDELHAKRQQLLDRIQALADIISQYEPVKVEHMQHTGYYISVSNLKSRKILKQNLNLTFSSNKTSTRITSAETDASNRRIASLDESIKNLTKKKLGRVTRHFLTKYGATFEKVSSFVARVDVTKSNWTTASMYNYCRPKICDGPPAALRVPQQKQFRTKALGSSAKASGSFIDAKDLRHPVMERMDMDTAYVPNDIFLGGGMVLYSINSCGKTSLLKACGLSVILAQMGCYVPASEFRFHPFRCIMTRILSEDNFAKGQSSFVAEMSELRAIIKRAVDASTLVLADEITHGTEHTSGSAIFVSSVETLARRNVNFLFTTHLHNVYPFIKTIENVRTCHLSVSFSDNPAAEALGSSSSNKLSSKGAKASGIIFERRLKDGPGNSVYGLEVCRFLDMDTNFLARAFEVRKLVVADKTEKTGVSALKLSRYNKKKSVLSCEMCGYSPKTKMDMPIDVHHIEEQHLADENGMINGAHKHAKANLVALCKTCHISTHSSTKLSPATKVFPSTEVLGKGGKGSKSKENLTIKGYMSTSSGAKLEFTPCK